MNELPKELSNELLGLVLDEKYTPYNLMIEDNDLEYSVDVHSDSLGEYKDKSINLDTLTREMKEWCVKQDFYINSWIASGEDNCYAELEDGGFTVWNEYQAPTELETVIQATHYVAKEKGLL